MWTTDIQHDSTTVSSTTTGTSNDHKGPIDYQSNEHKQTLPNIFTSELDHNVDKHIKPKTACIVHHKRFKRDKLLKETIRKWQMWNLAKCVLENSVNLLLESFSEDSNIPDRENLNISGSNFSFENEAVLMAIEEHGLKQAAECSCSENTEIDTNQDLHSVASCSKSDFYKRVKSSNDYFPEENQEYNFENNFMATAVSAAIEEKGLSIYPS